MRDANLSRAPRELGPNERLVSAPPAAKHFYPRRLGLGLGLALALGPALGGGAQLKLKDLFASTPLACAHRLPPSSEPLGGLEACGPSVESWRPLRGVAPALIEHFELPLWLANFYHCCIMMLAGRSARGIITRTKPLRPGAGASATAWRRQQQQRCALLERRLLAPIEPRASLALLAVCAPIPLLRACLVPGPEGALSLSPYAGQLFIRDPWP